MKTIAILFVNYGPYHIARVTALAEAYSDRNFKVVGIELARQELEYAWIANTEKLPFVLYSLVSDQLLQQIPVYEVTSRLIILLKNLKPDVIAISGYSHPAMLLALFWSQWKRKIAILLSETTEYDEPRVGLKEQIKRWLIGQYQAALVGGKPHQRYLLKLGMAKAAIFTGYDVVGNDDYHPEKIRLLPKPINQPYFLAINRFVTKKNLPFLINAYAAYRQANNQEAWNLVLCGDGEMRPQLEQQIAKLGLQDSVHLPGFLQQEELLPYFAHAKCFIHASIQEQWGLVVNEAMAAGLPVLVSKIGRAHV